MAPPKLSILICHLAARGELLGRLQRILQPQIVGRPVEILTETDEGQTPIGAKRNLLVQRATGEFVAFVDDDDRVSDDYTARILAAITTDPTLDCLGIEGLITQGGPRRLFPKLFIHSIVYDRWFEDAAAYYRPPNHLNPIARRHASQVPFPEKNIGEDHAWSMAIRPRLQRETYLKGPIYFYECR
jgi:glycosyltransferase involved in cell wall biosynthesis